MFFAENAWCAFIYLEPQETHAPGKKSHGGPLGYSTICRGTNYKRVGRVHSLLSLDTPMSQFKLLTEMPYSTHQARLVNFPVLAVHLLQNNWVPGGVSLVGGNV